MRKLSELFSADFEDLFTLSEMTISEDSEFLNTLEAIESNRSIKRRTRRKRLMLSEWLMEKPKDFEDNWMVKLCPVGKRHLIIADRKITKAFSKDGVMIHKFSSVLPGGSEHSDYANAFTVLDCIFVPHRQCYFVVDIIAWNSVSMRQLDVECRYFWVKSKLEETFKIQEQEEDINKYPFFEIETFSADLLEEKLSYPYILNNDPTLSLDGILFYLKDVPYIMRITPLVGWLKPFMVREVLGISTHESFQSPPGYTLMKEYLVQCRRIKKQSKKKQQPEQNTSTA